MSILRPLNRRQLLGLGALTASAAGIDSLLGAGVTGADAAVMRPGEFDQSFLAKRADIRQIWDFTSIDQVQTGIGAMKNAMNAYQFSYRKSHYLVIDLRGPSAVIYALDDTMWATYKLGAKYQIFDTVGGSFATVNPLYKRVNTDNGTLAPDNTKSLYQDASLAALQQRGAHIAACHDALQSQAALAVKDGRAATGMTAAQVFADFSRHLVPGAQQTPSGSSLIAVAQQLGFTYAKQ